MDYLIFLLREIRPPYGRPALRLGFDFGLRPPLKMTRENVFLLRKILLDFVSHCFAVRLRYAPLRMTRAGFRFAGEYVFN